MAEAAASPSKGFSREDAEKLDQDDPLRGFRSEFVFPSKDDLEAITVPKTLNLESEGKDESIYLCGNSLGLQPRRMADRLVEHLSVWATKGVTGHFFQHEDSNAPPFIHADDLGAAKMAPLVGASQEEVAVMETLTANLHFLMASFYKPTKEKYKIIIESKAFPSDHYATSSQILFHGLDPADALVTIEPESALATLTTKQILEVIDQHAATTALILLPGIQYYTGQLLDIPRITAHAHSKGLLIGWDLAHAVGNVELKLHDWDVDFAAWCTYKYVNAGPGSIAGLFVHQKHGVVDHEASGDAQPFRPRLSGWWGGDKQIRFEMNSTFVPRAGAAGFQVGNPSALAIQALLATLEIFEQTSMHDLRAKSVKITGFLEQLLLQPDEDGEPALYKIITPSDPAQRGAQLSLQLEPDLLDGVLNALEEAGVVVDERKPDVIRVAPAPLYNSYLDVWMFTEVFRRACREAQARKQARLVHRFGNM